MRLAAVEMGAIKAAAAGAAGSSVVVRPFGRRVDDALDGDDVLLEMATMTTRYEMTQDLISRRLSRSVPAMRESRPRTRSLAEAIKAIAARGIVTDLFDETRSRNCATALRTTKS